MCISWTRKGLMSLMHGITMKMTVAMFIPAGHCARSVPPCSVFFNTTAEQTWGTEFHYHRQGSHTYCTLQTYFRENFWSCVQINTSCGSKVDVPDNLLYRSECNHARSFEFRTLSAMNSIVAVIGTVMDFRYDRVRPSFVC